MLGKSGEQLWLYANGLDDSPVRRYEDRQEVKSVSRGMTFRRDLVNMEEVRCGVSVLVDEIAATLRQSGLKGSVISVTLKAPTLHTLSHQVTLPHPTYLQQEIRTVTMQLITDHWSVSAKSPVRSITVGVSHLSGENEAYTEQLSLFDSAQRSECAGGCGRSGKAGKSGGGSGEAAAAAWQRCGVPWLLRQR